MQIVRVCVMVAGSNVNEWMQWQRWPWVILCWDNWASGNRMGCICGVLHLGIWQCVSLSLTSLADRSGQDALPVQVRKMSEFILQPELERYLCHWQKELIRSMMAGWPWRRHSWPFSLVTCYCLTTSQNLVTLKQFTISHSFVAWFSGSSGLSSFSQQVGWGLGGTAGPLHVVLYLGLMAWRSQYQGGRGVVSKPLLKDLTTSLSPHSFGPSKSQGWSRFKAWGNRLLILIGGAAKYGPYFQSIIIMYPKHSCISHWFTSAF